MARGAVCLFHNKSRNKDVSLFFVHDTYMGRVKQIL
jgi:hypothetical protein